MSAGSHWVIAIVVALLIGGIATVLIWQVLLRRDETAAGIKALAATSWREFINMVLAALAGRGYRRVVDQEVASGDGDFILERDGRHWLLSCKHGSAYVLGRHAVDELANDIRLANASGGFLVTQGRILDEARKPAENRHIELLDGPALWPELRGLIKPEQLAAIRAGAATHARQRTLLAWLGALVIGIATYVLLPEPRPAAATIQVPAAAPAWSAPAEDATAEDRERANLPIAQQREALAADVSTLPLVERAIWSSQSTLEVHLLDASEDAMPGICPLVERYPDLAASRIQLTPPADSGTGVRFRQCRAF